MAKSDDSEGIFETFKTVAVALLLAGLIRTLFFQPFYIPTGSMKPTLLIGDFLLVNKMSYGYSRYSCPFAICPISGRIFASEPDRGDIVVFRHPTIGEDYIKRLIGLPGDTIEVIDGRLVLNGAPVPLDATDVFVEANTPQRGSYPRCTNAPVGLGGECEKTQYIETLPGGGPHAVLDAANSAADNAGVYTVPEGHYFFMGDNRDNSIDSRYFSRAQFAQFRGAIEGRAPSDPGGVAFIPAENLIGKANLVVFSAAGSSLFKVWTWRMDRFFEWAS